MIIIICFSKVYNRVFLRLTKLVITYKGRFSTSEGKMQQAQDSLRENSISNNSSTLNIKKRVTDSAKAFKTFTEMLHQSKPSQKNPKNISTLQYQIPLNASQTSEIKKQYKMHKIQQQDSILNNHETPHFSQLFMEQKLSTQYIQLMQTNKFKHLVIVSVILPNQLMKNFWNLIYFPSQNKIYTPETTFFSQLFNVQGKFNMIGNITYLFWIYELSEAEETIRNSSHTNLEYGKTKCNPLSMSTRTIDEYQKKRINKSPATLRSMMVELSQILITTKKFLQNNPDLIFHQLELGNVNNLKLSAQLDVEKSLFYFGDDCSELQSEKLPEKSKEINNSQRIIQKTSGKKHKAKGQQYISIEPEEQCYDIDGRQRDDIPILAKYNQKRAQVKEKNQLKSIHLSQQNTLHQSHQKTRFLYRLQHKSIFKHITYFPQAWLLDDSSEKKWPLMSKKDSIINKKNKILCKSQKRQKFMLLLQEEIQLISKKNICYSKFCSTYIFLYFLTKYYRYIDSFGKNQLRSDQGQGEKLSHLYSKLLMESLNQSPQCFKSEVEERFARSIKNHYKTVLDDDSFRNLMRNIKKDQIIFVKKNLETILFPTYHSKFASDLLLNQVFDRIYVNDFQEEILSSLNSIERRTYELNDKQASKFNQHLLEIQYQNIIQQGFARQKLRKKSSLSSESSFNKDQEQLANNLTQNSKQISCEIISQSLQKDLNHFIDAYWSKAIKVSSQLKTFNDFMSQVKKSYLKQVHNLIREKKSLQKQQQQREKKIREVKLLQMEIFKLEDKRRQVKERNEIIKNKNKIKADKFLLQRKELNKNRPKQKNREQKSGHTLFLSKLGNFDRKIQKKNSLIESKSNDKKNSKFPALSFQIENKRNNRKSAQKEYNKYNYNRNNQNNHQYNKKQSLEIKKETENFQNQENTKKNRCLSSCCQII